MDSNDKGEIALLKVEIRAAEQGIVVLKPTTSHRRYDIVLDCGGRFYRAQVKWAGSKSVKAADSFLLDLRKVTRGGQQSKLFYSQDEIDVVLVYLPNLDKVLWLGPEIFHGRENLTLRTAPAKNSQTKKCLMAADYIW
jgi:hypothetical protein